MSILVTGAAEFIFTNLVAHRLLQDYRVLAIENLSRGTLSPKHQPGLVHAC